MTWGLKSRQERGYGSAWSKLRKLVIERDKGLCQACLKEGRVTQGKDVDHIVSKAKAAKLGWTQSQVDNVANCQYLCRAHHLQKTKEEVGATYRPKLTYGLDGWPIEEK